MEIYVVKEEDSIDDIAEALEISPQQLIFDNQLIYPYALAIGQALLVEKGARSAARGHIRQRIRLPLYQSLGVRTDPSLFDSSACLFLWLYSGRRASSAALRRGPMDDLGGASIRSPAYSHSHSFRSRRQF